MGFVGLAWAGELPAAAMGFVAGAAGGTCLGLLARKFVRQARKAATGLGTGLLIGALCGGAVIVALVAILLARWTAAEAHVWCPGMMRPAGALGDPQEQLRPE